MSKNNEDKPAADFIRTIVQDDLRSGKHDTIQTRFPPEPNGYLHAGHAKSICLNFGIAKEFDGKCNLRFDDTNPEKENPEYVQSIQEDVKWLGFNWQGSPLFASDYFDRLYLWAEELIINNKAYVDDLAPDEIREYRGTLTEPGKKSPWRDRPPEESLDLFRRMKVGEFEEGEHVLRAKIDMASSNLSLRDPVIYRIKKVPHHRTGDKWLIYPMYDFTHCLSDALEGITHSLCTLEFENNRPLYDWFLDNLSVPCHPRQIEFARLNLSHTVLSKRKLIRLVAEKQVSGWDDPRMPTIAGIRRRGYTPLSLRNFCDRIGLAKRMGQVDIALLEHTVREDLNDTAPRVMAVLNPLKVKIENFPQDHVEMLTIPNHPTDESMGTRTLPFSGELYIERDDFMEDPPKKFFRLAPGREVRLRYAFYLTCQKAVKDEATGEIKELICTYDPATKGGSAPDGRKVKATLHWVSAPHAFETQVRLYDHLFTHPDPEDTPEEEDFMYHLNPDSLKVLNKCKLEPGLADAEPESRFQFERIGYFCVDSKDSRPGKPVFNRTVTLRDDWARIQKKQNKK